VTALAREICSISSIRLSVTLPPPKRKYGYFVLPILHQGQLIGRLDAKAWRKEGRLEVIRLFLEPGITISAGLIKALAKTLRAYANWQGLSSVVIDWQTRKHCV